MHLRIAIFWWSLHIFSGNSDYQPPFAAALHAFTPTSTYQLTESVKANQWVGMRHLRDSPLQGWCTSRHLSNCTSGAFRGGAGGSPPPLIFRPNWGQRGRKNFLGRPLPPPPPPFSKGLNDRPLAYRKVLIRHCVPLLHTNPVIFTAGFVLWYYRWAPLRVLRVEHL